MSTRADVIAHVRRRIAGETTLEGLQGVRVAAEVQNAFADVQGDLMRREAELKAAAGRRAGHVSRGMVRGR